LSKHFPVISGVLLQDSAVGGATPFCTIPYTSPCFLSPKYFWRYTVTAQSWRDRYNRFCEVTCERNSGKV